jgi:DNA primase
MPMISPHTREQIRAASDIVEVIGGYLPLRRAGTNFVALCPFHREKTPSFHVSPSRQAFHCFGCHKGGDVFRFLQDYENLSFVDAAKRLAERAGIKLEFDETPGQREERAVQDQLRELHEQITQRWQQSLQTDAGGQIARDYLAQRHVPGEAVQIFRLGYAPDAWDDTVNWARGKGWSPRLVEMAGLIIPRDPNDPSRGHYDRFRGRLMFPICDEQGRVIGFSGRILQGDEKTAKYVNSPETPIFTKSRVLYGLDKTKRAILDAGSAIICEGQLDLIACFMSGVQNAVAPQGTALTGDHLRILRRYAQEVILCFDSDNAGQKAAARVLDELLASGLSVRVITVPAPHDPDSYIREHGPEAFRQLAASARDFFEFYLDFLGRQHDLSTDRGRLAVLDAMAGALGKCGNDVLTDRYAQRTAMALAAGGRVALSPDAVRAEFRKRASRPTRTAGAQRPVTPAFGGHRDVRGRIRPGDRAGGPALDPGILVAEIAVPQRRVRRLARLAPGGRLDPAFRRSKTGGNLAPPSPSRHLGKSSGLPRRTRRSQPSQPGLRSHVRQPTDPQSGTAVVRPGPASAQHLDRTANGPSHRPGGSTRDPPTRIAPPCCITSRNSAASSADP